jgi:hypothetical protein
MKFDPNPHRLTNAPEKAPFCQAPVVNEAGTRRACASHRHHLPDASFEGNEISVACACMRIGRACNGPDTTL